MNGTFEHGHSPSQGCLLNLDLVIVFGPVLDQAGVFALVSL